VLIDAVGLLKQNQQKGGEREIIRSSPKSLKKHKRKFPTESGPPGGLEQKESGSTE